jgi:Coenzyme PQQ synthesis protein D (PqqD)
MSAVDSTFFTLHEVATVAWQAADGCTPLAEIVERRVCGEFEVEPDVARRDAEQFVSELSQHGILLVSDQPIPEAKPGTAEAQ